MEGYRIINGKLKEMYQMITFGGDAQLDLCNSLDPFIDGVSFSVRPPKKSWKQISNLSGGEKTLASLALVFGLHHYRPCPLYVMDEIDAALDFRNVAIIASYIKVSSTANIRQHHLFCQNLGKDEECPVHCDLAQEQYVRERGLPGRNLQNQRLHLRCTDCSQNSAGATEEG